MLNVFICFGYSGVGKSYLSDIIKKNTNSKIFAVDSFDDKIDKKDIDFNSEHFAALLNDKYGRRYCNMLFSMNSCDLSNYQSIIIDAPLIDSKRRKALFEVLNNMQLSKLFLIQLQCINIIIWNERISQKSAKISYETHKQYRDNFIPINLKECETLLCKNIIAFNIDTSENMLFPFNQIFSRGEVNIDEFEDLMSNEIQLNYRKELDIENYKMIINYISDLSKKIDLYIKLNLTLFVAVITFIISNLPDPLIKFAFIPLSLINWISYKYFDANNKLLVTMQAHLANTYEKGLKFGWYAKSLKFRNLKSKKERKKKHFSPINFYGFLISFSVGFYFILTVYELIISKTKLIINFSLPIDYMLSLNLIVLFAFLIWGIYASKVIFYYPDWPSIFNEKNKKFKKIR